MPREAIVAIDQLPRTGGPQTDLQPAPPYAKAAAAAIHSPGSPWKVLEFTEADGLAPREVALHAKRQQTRLRHWLDERRVELGRRVIPDEARMLAGMRRVDDPEIVAFTYVVYAPTGQR